MLEDRYIAEWGNHKLEERIIKTSLQHGVLSRFTAYVAIDRSEVVTEGGQVRRIVQPVEAPAGWAMFEVAYQVALPSRAKTFAISLRGAGNRFWGIYERAIERRQKAIGYLLRSPQKILETLLQLDRDDKGEVWEFLQALTPVIEEWLRLLKRAKEASELIAQLEGLLADLRSILAGSLPSRAEQDHLLERCRQVLEEMVQRNLPPERRWWW